MRSSKILHLSFYAVLFIHSKIFAQQFDDIKRYKVNLSIASKSSEKLIATRSFISSNQKYLLLIDPKTLDTKVDLAKDYVLSNIEYSNVLAIFKNTAYVKSLEEAANKGSQLQYAGIDHAIPNEKGITLTIDLCPSHKPLDRIIFQSVFDGFKKKSSLLRWLFQYPENG